ncbi:hypothetical protein F2Q70_00027246 [Brassica cretica]|uniref:Uncharacterized protein n=1 Tax=Brassica cretica TaxID=69181 RepID=A0A8S9L972_BRACR|nr:hypothetical protein F2Q70_00027246 [Brassica cretica]
MRVGLFLCSGPYGPSSLWPVDTALRSNEYDEDYREEHAIEHQSLAMEERVIHHSSKTEEAKSIDGNCSPIDPHSTPTSEGPMRPRRAMDGRVQQISRENIADTPEMANGPDNLFLQQRRDPEYQHRVIDELSATACGLETRYEYQKRTRGRKSIDGPIPPSIDDCLEFGRRAYDQNGQRIFHCKKRDERTSESFWKELQCMSALIYVFQDMQRDTLSPCQSHALTTKKSISWLTTRTDEMKQDIATIQQQQMTRARASKSIDGDSHKSIDSRLALFEERLQSFEDILDKVKKRKKKEPSRRLPKSTDETMSTSIDNTTLETIDGTIIPSIDPKFDRKGFEQDLVATTIKACFIKNSGRETRYEYQKRTRGRKSIDGPVPPSIDDCLEFGRRAYDQNGQRIFHCKKRDEYVVYRDDHGYARVLDGRGIHVSNEDIRVILERAAMHERSYICLPKHAEGYTQSMPEPCTYNKEERLDDVYYPFDNSISWLTTRTDEMKQDRTMILQQQTTRAQDSKSIDGDSYKSIDSRLALFEERLQSFEDILDKGSIGHLERRMHTVEGTVAVLKNHWTRAEEAIRSFIGTWFQKDKEAVDTCFPTSQKKKEKRKKKEPSRRVPKSTDETMSTSIDSTTLETIDGTIIPSIDPKFGQNCLSWGLVYKGTDFSYKSGRCIVENDGMDDVLVEAAVAVTSGEENDGKDDVPEDKGSESVMEGDKDEGEEEDDNEYRCIVENDGVDGVLVEAAVAVTSGEENDGKDDVPEDKGSESVMEGDKDGGEEEDDNEE